MLELLAATGVDIVNFVVMLHQLGHSCVFSVLRGLPVVLERLECPYLIQCLPLELDTFSFLHSPAGHTCDSLQYELP